MILAQSTEDVPSVITKELHRGQIRVRYTERVLYRLCIEDVDDVLVRQVRRKLKKDKNRKTLLMNYVKFQISEVESEETKSWG
ncbi:hypothetical protein Clacol_009781 [Clathrus columnatus]|uniref:Uncharacterized protein n=1 Tax=Clathrus columnatus TaxID=1419009 RepID=A0AAV5AR46_9AGAM|nr:hypothetical protein Clacol_009781 [Clathrus columnatus]